MRTFSAKLLRNHWHVLLIVPLVVIVMTWPTFLRIFDNEEFWLYDTNFDVYFKLWDAWYLERVLAGQAEFYFTDKIFHPRGISLAFHQISLPQSLLTLAFHKVIPVDDAYNLASLLILCLNAFCAYLLIQHLIKDKWIALYGAVAVGVASLLTHHSLLPDLITFGTIPLSIFVLHRSIVEGRWRLAALAGMFAGLTAFIGMYIFLINLMTIGIYSCFLALKRWRTRAFWRALMVFLAACGFFSIFRIYPMIADATQLLDRMQEHPDRVRSNDVLDYFVLAQNPLTGSFFQTVSDVSTDSREISGYLGYINLLFLASALVFSRHRRPLTPWIIMLGFFAIMRLGRFLTFNGADYRDIPLLEHYLVDWFPFVFQHFQGAKYYQIGIALPLAVLSCFGLAAVLRSKPTRIRIALVFISAFILAIESYVPRGEGRELKLELGKTAFVDWLRSTEESPLQLIHLPREPRRHTNYYLYLQTLVQFPHVYARANYTPQSAKAYIQNNLLLRAWQESRSIHCLHYNEQAYISALDSVLQGGSTYIVVHHWLWGDEFVMPSLANLPALYDNGFVSVYSLQDLRLNCQNQGGELPQFTHLAQSSWATPGSHASIVSFHPSQSIDTANFRYLRSLFSHWKSLLHVYLDKGELVIQNGGAFNEDVDAFARDNQIVYLVYNANTSDESPTDTLKFLNRFSFCQRDAHDDGAVIELYLKPEFYCALYSSEDPFQVRYDNGAQLENLLYEFNQDVLDLQILWRNLPDETHSLSVQLFDAAGDKAHGQDSVIGSRSITRHSLDLSSLPPGDYIVKLIFYRYSTGQSVRGTDSSSGESFERALTIATIHKS